MSRYDFGELDELVLAYATTVHKAQGSEYPAVVIPVTTQHYPMLQRNLLYTGVTRGRKLVVLVAQPKAVAIAVKGQHERRRWSKLREWLAVEPRAGRGDRMSFAIIRGGNGRRHEVDFGDDPIEIDVTASTLTVQITVEAVMDGVCP